MTTSYSQYNVGDEHSLWFVYVAGIPEKFQLATVSFILLFTMYLPVGAVGPGGRAV